MVNWLKDIVGMANLFCCISLIMMLVVEQTPIVAFASFIFLVNTILYLMRDNQKMRESKVTLFRFHLKALDGTVYSSKWTTDILGYQPYAGNQLVNIDMVEMPIDLGMIERYDP